jgi:adenylosuccinate lyase
MELTALSAISPIDGRYRNKIDNLGNFYSEYALIKYRVRVEVEYFIALCKTDVPQLSNFDSKKFIELRKIYTEFNEANALEIKDTEKITNHDVKAVEYFIKKRFDELGLHVFKDLIHFGLTSQDINNPSVPLSLKEGIQEELIPAIAQLLEVIANRASEWTEIPMLAKTHGQPASPTKLGKEFLVFHERIIKQLQLLNNVPFSAKFGGATGNLNAHHVAYKNIDWMEFANKFVEDTLGLSRSQYTTQIEHYDNLAALFDGIKRINTILIDLSRDVWQYVSMNYFKQKINKNEVGSSAMPHKVNPIDFENAEGNLGMANATFEHLSQKLPISRLQRDLTDSTVLRNIGVPLGHTQIAILSLLKGFSKLELNEAAITQDLEDNWAVVAEAIQTILRRENYPNPYETLKDLTRTNVKIDADSIGTFVDGLDVSDEIKAELRAITPFNYTGIF